MSCYFFGPGRKDCGDCFINLHGGTPVCTMNCSGRTCQTKSSQATGRGGDAGPGPAECSTAHSQTVSRTLLEIAFDLSQIKRWEGGNPMHSEQDRCWTVTVPGKLMDELDQIVRRYGNYLPSVRE